MTTKQHLELKPLFIERMQKLLPDKDDFEKYLEILKVPIVKSIRCNFLKISPDELRKRLEEKGWKIKQPWTSNFATRGTNLVGARLREDFPEVMIVEGKYFNDINDNYVDNNVSDNVDNSDKKRGDKLDVNDNNIDNCKTNLEGSNINNKGGSEQSELLGGNSRAERGEILIDLSPGELGNSLEHLLGYYYVQELASMLPVIALNPKPHETILDLCASPGSKTTQIASNINNTGLIIANEISLGRIKILANNLERCGVANVIITKKEGSAFCRRLSKLNFQFDKILVDAPCSGEGTLRSSPRTYIMWNINSVKQLSGMQKNLVSSVIPLLKVGGELVYSTCTHAPEENEEIVDFILKNFSSMKIEKISLPVKTREGITKWENREYSEKVKLACRIYPQDNNTEGFFVAKFKKVK